MENPIKMDDLGVPLFSETPIYFIMFHHMSHQLQYDSDCDQYHCHY